MQPTKSFPGCDRGTAVQAVSFNPKLKEYLASASSSGVKVWELGPRLTKSQPGEDRALGAVAAAESASDVQNILSRKWAR